MLIPLCQSMDTLGLSYTRKNTPEVCDNQCLYGVTLDMRLIKVKLNEVRWLIYEHQYLLKCMFHETSWVTFLLVCCTRLLIITCHYCLTGLILRLWVELLRFEIIHIRAKTPLPSAVIQWQSSDNPVCLELRPQCTLECHWRKNCWQSVCFQCAYSGLPVAFQWCSSVFKLCKWTLDRHWGTTGC